MSERVSVCEKENERMNERSDVSLNEMSLEEKLNMLSRQRWTKRGWITDRERKGQTAGRGQAGGDRQQVEGRKTLSHSNKRLSQGCRESRR